MVFRRVNLAVAVFSVLIVYSCGECRDEQSALTRSRPTSISFLMIYFAMINEWRSLYGAQ